MYDKDSLLIYNRYKFLSEETEDNRYLVIFGSLETGLTKEIYVAALNKRSALELAKIKLKEYYPEFFYDHHYIIKKEWPKVYLKAAKED